MGTWWVAFTKCSVEGSRLDGLLHGLLQAVANPGVGVFQGKGWQMCGRCSTHLLPPHVRYVFKPGDHTSDILPFPCCIFTALTNHFLDLCLQRWAGRQVSLLQQKISFPSYVRGALSLWSPLLSSWDSEAAH